MPYTVRGQIVSSSKSTTGWQISNSGINFASWPMNGFSLDTTSNIGLATGISATAFSTSNQAGAPTPGTANTGGGGGGQGAGRSASGAMGGSGIVILRYVTA